MRHYFGESGEEKCNIRQCSSCYQPRGALCLSQEGITHCHQGVTSIYPRGVWFWKKIGAVNARNPYDMLPSRQIASAESPLIHRGTQSTMNIRSVHSFSTKWLHSSCVYRYLIISNCCQHTCRIGCRLLKGGIPMNGTNTQKM